MNSFYLKVLSLMLFSFTSLSLSAQTLVINEVDADTPGTDYDEFLELYDGGVGNTSLDGYVIVFFNGSDTLSTGDAIDLDGYSTDANGFFVIGSSTVSNVDFTFSSVSNNIQNGADAIALFQANGTDFPNDSPITTTNLIDALVYDTNDSDHEGLLVLTPGEPQVDEAMNSDQSNHSIARATDGEGGPLVTSNYTAQTPTPGTSNSAPPATVVSFEAGSTTAFENDGTVTLTVSITNPSTDIATSVEVKLSAGDAADINNYSTQTVTFAAGSAEAQSVVVTITDDEVEEGTETLTFVLNNVAGGTNAVTTNATSTFELTIIDNEGSDYYAGVEGLTGNALKQKLHEIIREHKVYPYTSSSTDVWDILRDADEDPANADNVILLYSGRSIAKNSQDTGSGGDVWNREHVWPKSHGFPNQEDTAYTDTHHLRAAARDVNTVRSNKDFDNGGSEYTSTYGGAISLTDDDSWEPRDDVKGDVARMILYMATRYEGSYDLELVEYTNTPNDPILGKLTTLLAWHAEDPVSQEEKDRNEVIFGYQGNRNPFIDYPEFVNLIYDNLVEEVEEPLVAGDTLFVDNFDNCETTIANWTAYSVASINNFVCTTNGIEGTSGIEMNGYNEDEQSIDWFISQSFDFSAHDYPTFVFNTRTKYGDHKVQLMVSTNYTSGDPSTADWTELAISLPDNGSDAWTESGVDLSAYKTTNVTLAFKYVSSQDPARWRFDDFLIVAATEQYVDPNAVTTGNSSDGTGGDGTGGDGTEEPVLGTDEVVADKFEMYPNPASTELTVSGGSAEVERLTFYDLSGKLVKAYIFKGQQEVTVDVSGLKSGLYLLKVQTSEGVKTKRMSKN